MTPSPWHFLTRRLVALICAAGLIGCAPIPQPLAAAEGPLTYTVRVISNDWHTGIVVPRASLPPQRVPEAADFPSALFLEFGWGDREYYPSPRPSLGTTLAAALVPTSAVMHLAGLQAPPEDAYPDSEVLTVRLTAAGLDRLLAEIDASFERGGGIRAEAVARGLYRESRFYPARGGDSPVQYVQFVGRADAGCRRHRRIGFGGDDGGTPDVSPARPAERDATKPSARVRLPGVR